MLAMSRLFALCALGLAASVSAAPIQVARSSALSGQGTYFAPGLGACGITNADTDYIVAVSTTVFDNYPGATDNTNDNPICNQQITATYGTKSVTVTVVDRCEGCSENDLDFSPAAFQQLADESLGRIDISWSYADGSATTTTAAAASSSSSAAAVAATSTARMEASSASAAAASASAHAIGFDPSRGSKSWKEGPPPSA